MKRARDSQRKKVYEFDACLPNSFREMLKLSECIHIIHGMHKRYGRMSDMIVKDGRGKNHAAGGIRTIILPVLFRNVPTICHEYAHGMVDLRKPGCAAHGPEFMRMYIELLVWMKVNSRSGLMTLAHHRDIKIAGTISMRGLLITARQEVVSNNKIVKEKASDLRLHLESHAR